MPGDPWALRFAHNQFSDMDPKEFETYLGLNQAIPHKENALGLPQHSRGRHLADIPDTIDWSNRYHSNSHGQRKMYPVKNQGSCGSCWAFAVTSTLEGTLAIKTESAPIRLSEQQGVDCTLTKEYGKGGDYNDRDWGCWGCEGCWMENFYEYLKVYGAMKEEDYPYVAYEKKNCNMYNESKTVGKVGMWKAMSSVDEMKERAAQQPLDVAVCASGWGSFGTGVVRKNECCTGLNHAVTVVGYNLCGGSDGGDDTTPDPEPSPEPEPQPGPSDCSVDKWWYSCQESNARRLNDTCIPYWIIQNSWGTSWGDGGFVKLEITGDDDTVGTCGINKVAEYADWRDLY